MKHLLTLALLVAATPAGAAIHAAQNPLSVVQRVSTSVVELLVMDHQKTEVLPLECRGYYVRPHKQSGHSRCN